MEASVFTTDDLFKEVVSKINAGEPPPEFTIAGQTYVIKQSPKVGNIQEVISEIYSQLQEDKSAAMMTLLAAAIKGERIILVQQQNFFEGTLKYQFHFMKGELPNPPDTSDN